MRKTYLMLAFAFLATVAVAATQAPKLALFINGKLASGNVVVIKGQSYAPIPDVAKALGMTVSKSGNVISLEAGPGHASAVGKGSVEGTVTYYFNANYGNKPDVGTQIFLVSRDKWPNRWSHNLPEDQDVMGSSGLIFVSSGATPPSDGGAIEVQKYTAADGSGRFVIRDVAPGKYILVMRSKHVIKHTQRDDLGMFEVHSLEVKAGETTDCSSDFGMSE
jgi:hypothetical protein